MFFFINVLMISIAYTPFSFMNYERYGGTGVSAIQKISLNQNESRSDPYPNPLADH
jgi:hypothetical protein